jgi:hypothetical protein
MDFLPRNLPNFLHFYEFSRMTISRDEIVLEGQAADKTWFTYEFKYKPGSVDRMPPMVAPHQPRLDWQMWFAPLSPSNSNPWYYMFLVRLLEGSPDVASLLESVPKTKSVNIRSSYYNYHFTETGKNSTWWTRKTKGNYSENFLNFFLGFDYMPIASLKNSDLQQFKANFVRGSPSNGKIKTMYLSDIHVAIFGAFAALYLITLYFVHFRTTRVKREKVKSE